MGQTGGCFCGDVRYELTGDVLVNGACCCNSCQVFTGGAENPTVAIWAGEIKWTATAPAAFQKTPTGATRQFCAKCGTQITAQVPGAGAIMTIKAGTLDDLKSYAGPSVAIWTEDKPVWLALPTDCLTFEKGAPQMPKAF